jgi:hypothetical protein
MTLDQALELSSELADRVDGCPVSAAREQIWRKKAMVDFATFGLFKEANFGKALAWGAGLSLPALGAGHLLLRDARRQGEELVRDARNQALLTALGVGGLQALGGALSDGSWLKLGADDAPLRKLAALLLIDNLLCHALEKTAADERPDLEECLFINRARGVELLRQLS